MAEFNSVTILGAGPAGSAAALAALQAGAKATIIEKSRFPRHKVCGEFFSPEIERELKQLGAWDAFLQSGPSRLPRMVLHFGAKQKNSRLPDPAFGLSRFAFDRILLDQAMAAGATVAPDADAASPLVIATGRRATTGSRGQRLFGFKAHFEGPVDDAVELFFFGRCYVGVSCIESEKTNVCGLAPENFLTRFGFNYDEVVMQCPALAARLKPLRRITEWFSTGPLEYRQAFDPGGPSQYAAGDALSFVDPFTGSGLLAAVRSGAMAGRAAALGQPVENYLAECRRSLRQPFQAAGVLRLAVETGWAEKLARFVPGRLLFALTRPK